MESSPIGIVQKSVHNTKLTWTDPFFPTGLTPPPRQPFIHFIQTEQLHSKIKKLKITTTS